MNLHRFDGPLPAELAVGLATFECSFRYPLGPERWFRIDHGADYTRFYRAIGPACCFVAERDGEILGTLSVSICNVLCPDGVERRSAYLGDLKLSEAARGGFVLRRMALAAVEFAGPLTDAAFSVVMDGTRIVPSAYTGRIGIPPFRELGKVEVWRMAAQREGTQAKDVDWLSGVHAGAACFRRLSLGRFAPLGRQPAERSETPPVWLAHPQGLACGRLEDTRRAKRLFADDGAEMISAHLSCFAWETEEAGAHLLDVSARQCVERGFPALFVAVTEADGKRLRPLLQGREITIAPATIYGTGFESDESWNIHTAEI